MLRALALGLPSREVLYVTLEEHVLMRALALGPPNREVLYVTLRSTFGSGRWPLDSLAGRSYTRLVGARFGDCSLTPVLADTHPPRAGLCPAGS